MENLNKEWFVVNTYVGHENKVKENLIRRIETLDLQDTLFDIVVAEQVIVERVPVKSKKKKNTADSEKEQVDYVLKEKIQNLYPGYLFVQMIMTDESWYIVRNTPGVTGFIGSSGGGAKPFPMEESEIESVLSKVRLNEREVSKNYVVGDTVIILDGLFKGRKGEVIALDDERQVARVNITMFNREEPEDFEYINLKLDMETE